MYAYINLGYSPFKVFPEYRLGGELYKNLVYGFEISGGVRYLNFSTSDVLIYTGSLGKYFKDYWLAFRPFLTSMSSGHSISGVLFFRNYFIDSDNYVGFLLGYGSSPVDVIFLEDIERRNSFKTGIEIQRKIAHVLLINLRFRYEREEFREDWFGNRFIFELDLGKLTFKKY